MKTASRITVLASILLLAFSCGKEEDRPAAIFHSITPIQSSVTLEENGSADMEFMVYEPGYSFNHDVSSPDCAVSLRYQDGSEPTEFNITSIKSTDIHGKYSAVIVDLGTDDDYNEEVRFVMTLPQGTMVYSKPITVKSRNSDGRPKIRTGLPVVYVDTEDGKDIVSKEDYLHAVLKINGMGKFEDLEEVTCSIRGRGNTTWTWPKKPYLIKFDKKQSIFGLPKHKRWILLANFMDRTLMRNLIAYKIGSMTSLDWTPHCQSVELVMNGNHVGNYLLIEQVRADSNRVPCEDGFLLECDFHYDNEIQWIQTPGRCMQRPDGIPFGIKYPDVDDGLTDQKLREIKEYVGKTSASIYGEDFMDSAKGYANYLDVKSFIDYWIVFEVMINHELGNPGSVFMHKSADGKLTAGPLWDFDWGVLSYNVSPQARNSLVNKDSIWYTRLFDDPAFKEAVKTRWNELLPQLRTIPAFIGEMEKTLQASAELNFKMWDPAGDASQNNGNIVNGDERMTYNDAVARLKSIYEERLDIISKNL